MSTNPMLLRITLMIALLVGADLARAQSAKRQPRTKQPSALSTRQRELLQLQQTIQQRERVVRELAEQERTTARAVKEIERLLERQRRYVRLLEEELQSLAQRQKALELERSSYGAALSSDLERLRRFVLLLARADLIDDDDSPLDTAIVRAALRRLEQRLEATHRQHDSTTVAIDQLQQYRTARQVLAAQQKREQQRLERLLSLRTELLSRLRRNRLSVERELKELRQSMAAIERTIERLARSNRTTEAPPTSNKLPSLQPPVRGAIMRGYGEYRHPLTGARAYNAGVDIAAPVGTSVHAAAAGTVVSVEWLPAMNTVVIIDHGQGIRTVYGNLDRASVRKGDRVTAGQPIGSSGESLSGAFVHFEVWRGAERLDPSFIVR
jgi:murein DD-endopeptidase MepM/ murein hydrolase activator NlpD